MSLFRARELWSTAVSASNEVFDQGCMVISNIDNNSQNNARVITGSHSGILRIYAPQAEKNDSGTFIGFKADDLLLEIQLPHPILQLAVGKFVGSSNTDHLAILYPRKLSVCSVSSSIGAADYGSQYQLVTAYEHTLQRSAHSMVCGPFGGVKGRDFFCVQSLDGTVSFFEQESFAFSRFLPKFLLPGPIGYVQRNDSFVTVSSSYQLECYKYQVLAVAADSKTKEESQNIKQGKKVAVDWSYNLGEQAVSLYVSSFKNSVPSIFVLGERHIFCLKDTGLLRFLIKIDYSPSSFIPYQADGDGNIMMMVTTQTRTLLVYRESILQWAAQIPITPVCINHLTVTDMQGIICVLSDEGELQCLYLGTDPSLFTAPVHSAPDMNYNETDKELRELYKIIRASQKPAGIRKRNQSETKEELKLDITLSDKLMDLPDHVSPVSFDGEDKIPCVLLNVKMEPANIVNNVRLSISVNKPLEASQPVSDFHSLGQLVEIDCFLYLRYPFIPSNLTTCILIVYTNESGKQKLMSRNMDLPLSLVVRPCIPLKDLTHKITIDIKQSVPPLGLIFPEYGQENSESSTSAVGVHIFGSHDVAIFAAKSSNRYRIQSNCHEAMWLMLDQLIKRLSIYWNKPLDVAESPLGYNGSLPLKECFKLIDAHHECRLQIHRLQDQLTQNAAQYRAIQKRLLTKLKDKTPSPLTNLDVLLESTHHDIMEVTCEIETAEAELARLSCSLCCSIRIFQQLIRLQAQLDNQKYNLLCSAFSSNVCDVVDQQVGWQEITECAVKLLLNTCFGKLSDGVTPSSTNLSIMKDTSSLKRHLSQLVDKISINTNSMNLSSVQESATNLTVAPECGELESRLKPSIGLVSHPPIAESTCEEEKSITTDDDAQHSTDDIEF